MRREERAGLAASAALFRVGITPYYASLMDPVHASCPIRFSFGVCLWITRKSVDAMNGSIDVDSRPGEGTTFTVVLPRDLPRSRAS